MNDSLLKKPAHYNGRQVIIKTVRDAATMFAGEDNLSVGDFVEETPDGCKVWNDGKSVGFVFAGSQFSPTLKYNTGDAIGVCTDLHGMEFEFDGEPEKGKQLSYNKQKKKMSHSGSNPQLNYICGEIHKVGDKVWIVAMDMFK